MSDYTSFIQEEVERGNLVTYTKNDLMDHYGKSVIIDGKEPNLEVRGRGDKTYRAGIVNQKFVPSNFKAFQEVFDRKESLLVGDQLFKAYLHEGDNYNEVNLAVSELGYNFSLSTTSEGVVRFGEGYPVVKKIYN